jgi:hypothetical protein
MFLVIQQVTGMAFDSALYSSQCSWLSACTTNLQYSKRLLADLLHEEFC